KDKKVLILGLAKSGFYAAKLLNKLGAQVIVNDKKDLTKDKKANQLKKMGITIISGEHPSDLLKTKFDLLVKNPGIPYSNSVIKKAQSKKIPIITEVEVANSVSKGHLIGITGTNGKTTTTIIIQRMLSLNRSKGSAYAVGNIGVPASQLALNVEEIDDLVMELSSFQLEGTPTIHPEIAVVTNITKAHIDYHGSVEAYIEAKLKLVRNQTEEDVLIYNDDQKGLKELLRENSNAQLLPFSRQRYLKEGISTENNSIYFKEEKIADVSEISIKGKHNLENFLAAIAVAKVKKVRNKDIKKIMREFKGVKHRTQFVLEWNKRSFYNDSKATNIEATENALSGFSQPVILLAGGLDRGEDYKKLLPYLKKHVKAVVLFGETVNELEKIAKLAGIEEIRKVDEMKEAVKVAYRVSSPKDIILLSPAAASWDEYKNFEARGNHFIDSVNELINTANN
ncbi:MAG: UDP-N-acetylmuramoyl-L-alanine--D-glutamate ligase, partial [Atopostipes sp.]|nr:UDP-N-acetylmuramoyl-L-alanine--D-glutamate ligase [Atopostipes sp.]